MSLNIKNELDRELIESMINGKKAEVDPEEVIRTVGESYNEGLRLGIVGGIVSALALISLGTMFGYALEDLKDIKEQRKKRKGD